MEIPEIQILRSEILPVDELSLYIHNANEGDVGAIAASIQHLGQYKRIVVNEGTMTGRPMEILAGNHTWLAVQLLDRTKIAADIIDVDETMAMRINIADNRTRDLATTDDVQLAETLITLKREAGSLEGTGYDDDDLDELLKDLDQPFQAEGGAVDEYYTPEWLFEAMALQFDLDVAAPAGGVVYLPAERFYTKADDGLVQPWEGLVWMNPPFSGPTPWVDRFIDHGNGVCLLPFAESKWCQKILANLDLVAIVWTKMLFHRPVEGDDQGGIAYKTFVGARGPAAIEGLKRLAAAHPTALLQPLPSEDA